MLLGHVFAAARDEIGSHVFFTTPMLTVLRLISLKVPLAVGSARVTGLDASY